MPAPLLLPLLSAVPGIAQAVTGLFQGSQANKLKKQNTEPAAFTEAMQLGQQAYRDQRAPGQSRLLDQVAQATANTTAAATQAGGSSVSVLGLLNAADRNRQNAVADAGVRAEQNRQVQGQRLGALLGQRAQYQQKDQQELDRAKSALTEARIRNVNNGLQNMTSSAVYALSQNNPNSPTYTGGARFANPGLLNPSTVDAFNANPTNGAFSTMPAAQMRALNPFAFLS